MNSFDAIESRLQHMLEDRLLRMLPGYKTEDQLPQRLAKAMYANLRPIEGGSLAPNYYVVITHPSTLPEWQAQMLHDEIVLKAIKETGEEAGFKFLSHPQLALSTDSDLETGEYKIVATFTEDDLEETKNEPVKVHQLSEQNTPANAFLILQGTDILPLTRSVTNIGRRLDNQVVVDDPRVSRNHAQIRVIKERFVIFDLESTGGMFVNGQRTAQSVLYPGDVISLAGVTLVFGQDLPPDQRSALDRPVSTLSADRPTVLLKKENNR